MPRLLLQQTLRGSRTWSAVAAKHPIRLALQTLGEGGGEGLACDAPLECKTLQSSMGLEARRGFLLSSISRVNVEVGTMGESITGESLSWPKIIPLQLFIMIQLAELSYGEVQRAP